jgi:hypothetical protein
MVNPGTQPKKRTGVWIFLAVFAVFLSLLVAGSMRVVEVECSLCVEFRGQRQCRTGSGATRAEAQSAAQRAACAVMANGMNESIACGNVRPQQLSCSE